MSNNEHLEILKKGVDFWNKNRPEFPDLSGANLGGTNLSGADLSDTILDGLDFSGINLSKANLNKANLTKANLSGANLSEANLSEANLSEANLSDSNLSGADIRDTTFSETNFNGANLSKLDFSGMDLRDVNLKGTNLSHAKLIQTNLSNANLKGANLTRATLILTNLQLANLIGTNIVQSDLSGANLMQADLSLSHILGSLLLEAKLNTANLSSSIFNGAVLNMATLIGANLTGATFSQTSLSETNLTHASCKDAVFFKANLEFSRLTNINLDGANLTGVRLWEAQRAGWSIKDVICEYAYLENNDTPTYFSPGEFEKLYSDKTKIVLAYKDCITPLEIATLPALIKHLESSYPGCSLRLESISEAPGGASVTLVVENESNFSSEEKIQLKAQLEEKGKEAVEFQKLALKEKDNRLLLEGKVEALSDVVKEFIMRPNQHYGDTIHGGKIMGDNYNQGQGIQGKNVHDIHDINFNQIGGQIEKSMDLAELASQLKQLREAMILEAKEPEHYIAIGELAKAEKAAEEKDSTKVAESLKSAGKWALDFATKIGTTLATDALKKLIEP